MYKLFEQTFTKNAQLEQYIFNKIDTYIRNSKSNINTSDVINYLEILIYYIEEHCPKKERNLLKLISLTKQSINENGTTVSATDLLFANLMSKSPDDYIPLKYSMIRDNITNEDIYDILLFLKYDLLMTMVNEKQPKSNEDIEAKYAKENSLLDEAIEKIEKVLEDEDEEFEDEDYELSEDTKNKIDKFLEEYKPYKIKEYLDKYIIGQEEAKRTVSTTIYNHILLIAHPELNLRKNNLLMVGPSGCGKTEIMRVISKILPIPISIFDTSGMSQNGWKGDKKAKDSIKELLLKTNDKSLAECGIVFLDEFDKVCKPAFSSNGDNVSIHIQGELLAMIEGADVEVNIAGEDILGMTELVNTKKILFICAGAFQGIEDIVKKERNKNATIGFNSETKNTSSIITAKEITKEIIIKFGVTPELAGRLTVTTVLNKLTKKDMYDILTKCENNVVSELHNILEKGYNVKLTITEEAYKTLIDKLCMDVGARGLRSIVFEQFNDIMFELSSMENVREVVLKGDLNVEYLYN